MQTQAVIDYEQILNLAIKLPQSDKKKLISELKKKSIYVSERILGKYEGQGWISEDFNNELEDFKEFTP